MQFLEWSFIGLRSARLVLRHDERGLSVTLFPMVHLAEPAFFERVYADASAHDAVVLEGINSRVGRRLTRVYRWVSTARLGLVVQPRYSIEGIRKVHADLSGEEFEKLWRAAPYFERFIMEAGAGAVGLWLRLFATRTTIGKKLDTTDLPDREFVLAWDDGYAPIHEALFTSRDQALCRRLTELLEEDGGPRSVAVIYGAGHMSAAAHHLHKAGFRLIGSEWMQVFQA